MNTETLRQKAKILNDLAEILEQCDRLDINWVEILKQHTQDKPSLTVEMVNNVLKDGPKRQMYIAGKLNITTVTLCRFLKAFKDEFVFRGKGWIACH